jgi:hypothetical protein
MPHPESQDKAIIHCAYLPLYTSSTKSRKAYRFRLLPIYKGHHNLNTDFIHKIRYLEVTEENHEKPYVNISLCPNRGSNRVPSESNSEALAQYQSSGSLGLSNYPRFFLSYLLSLSVSSFFLSLFPLSFFVS